MSDRADFLAGIAASGFGSQYGIEGDDFGSFYAPYPDPSPPGGVHGGFDHSMSDDDLVSCDETSDSSVPIEVTKASKPKKQTSKLSRGLRRAQTTDKKKEKKKLMVKKTQDMKTKRRILAANHLSKDSKKNLERIAEQARSEFGASVEKTTDHLGWAAKTLNTAGYAYYINLFGGDNEMQYELILQQRREKPSKATTLAMSQPNLTKDERQTLYRETDKKGPTRSQQRQLKSTGTSNEPHIRPSRKERPLALFKASRARRDKFNEMV